MIKYLLFAFFLNKVNSEPKQMIAGLNLAEQKPGIVIDVGANGGKETMLALERGRKVLAVECLSSAYMNLLDMFQNKKNVTLVHICAGENTEIKTLHLADDSSSLFYKNIDSGAERIKALRLHNKLRKNKETVITLPLDNIVNEPVSLIKIDVQGYEQAVLKGAKRLINTYKHVIIYEDVPSFEKNREFHIPGGYTCNKVNGDKVCTYM